MAQIIIAEEFNRYNSSPQIRVDGDSERTQGFAGTFGHDRCDNHVLIDGSRWLVIMLGKNAISPEGKGRLAVITGATGGQGSSAARAFAAHGFAVGLIDVNEASLGALRAELSTLGAAVSTATADVSDRRSVEQALERFETDLGPLFVLAHTAAILRGALLLDNEDGLFDDVLRVNLRGAYVTNTTAARMMRRTKQGGRIINWSSTAAHYGSLGYGAYCASKAALESLTKSLSVEVAADQITVNALVPGSIVTPMLGYIDAESFQREAKAIPLQRLGDPADVTAAALFLASDAAAWITGVSLPVDGGFLATKAPPNVQAVRARIERERAYLRSGKRSDPEVKSG